ncbi:MAG: endonuclease III domain-containing protein [Candidatus Geothermarchaeales archaeon]
MKPPDVQTLYERLLRHFGAQGWWPAETRFEVMVGAILTQRTVWRNADRVIESLRGEDLMTPLSLAKVDPKRLEALVRPAGFYRQKAKRLIDLAQFIVKRFGGSLEALFDRPTGELRETLMSLPGVGRETADSILLYAADKLVFPVDAYTRRVCSRLGLIESEGVDYEELRSLFEDGLPRDLRVYGELRALLVRLGKAYCRVKPRCKECPLVELCDFAREQMV